MTHTLASLPPPAPVKAPRHRQRGCGLFGHSWWTGRGLWQRSDCIKHHWSSRSIPPFTKQTLLWLCLESSNLLFYLIIITSCKDDNIKALFLLLHTVIAHKKTMFHVIHAYFLAPLEVAQTAWGFGPFCVISAVVCAQAKGCKSSER